MATSILRKSVMNQLHLEMSQSKRINLYNLLVLVQVSKLKNTALKRIFKHWFDWGRCRRIGLGQLCIQSNLFLVEYVLLFIHTQWTNIILKLFVLLFAMKASVATHSVCHGCSLFFCRSKHLQCSSSSAEITRGNISSKINVTTLPILFSVHR